MTTTAVGVGAWDRYRVRCSHKHKVENIQRAGESYLYCTSRRMVSSIRDGLFGQWFGPKLLKIEDVISARGFAVIVVSIPHSGKHLTEASRQSFCLPGWT